MTSDRSKDTAALENPAAPAQDAATLVLFGARSLCGEALLAQLPPSQPVHCLGRGAPAGAGLDPRLDWTACDLTCLTPAALEAAAAALPRTPQLWLSFAPLWHLAPFLAAMAERHPRDLRPVRALVACSSSSVVTKRFAANRFDRELVTFLTAAQRQLEATCEAHGIPLRILAPTLIHGRTAHHADRNVETLRHLLRRLPLLPLPRHTGLRQPVAAADLAAVALAQAGRLAAEPVRHDRGQTLLLLGGDESLPYRALLERIQKEDPATRRCRLVSLPTRLFHFLAAPLLLLNPRAFEAVLRIGADLAGFPTTAELLGRPPRPFRPRQAP